MSCAYYNDNFSRGFHLGVEYIVGVCGFRVTYYFDVFVPYRVTRRSSIIS
jgi:hypothetical protein